MLTIEVFPEHTYTKSMRPRIRAICYHFFGSFTASSGGSFWCVSWVQHCPTNLPLDEFGTWNAARWQVEEEEVSKGHNLNMHLFDAEN